MNEFRPVTRRLLGKTRVQVAAIAFGDADAADDVVQELVTGPKQRRRHHRPEILQANPACDDHWGGQDQLENLEALVLLPDIVVQEDLPLERASRRPKSQGRDEGLAAGEAEFGTDFRPVAAAFNDAVIRCAGQTTRPLGPRRLPGLGKPSPDLDDLLGPDLPVDVVL